jgi:hypothetical protein
MEGMAFGTGSAIAHRAVGAIAGSFGGGSDKPAEAAAAPAAAPESATTYVGARGQDCSVFQRDFTMCLQDNKNDISSCQMYMDNLKQCQMDNRLA